MFIRYYLAVQDVSAASEPIGGVIGFCRALNFIAETFQPHKMIVVWEAGGPSARRKHIHPGYKQNRAKLREAALTNKDSGDMRKYLAHDQETKARQLLILSQLLKHTPIYQVYVSGTEGDDIVAYIAKEKYGKHSEYSETKKIVISGDKDFYQLLAEENTMIYDPARKNFITPKYVLEEFGVHVNNFALAKAAVGDPSDNIDGIPLVGFKTLSKYIPSLSESKELLIKDLIDECRTKYQQESEVVLEGQIKSKKKAKTKVPQTVVNIMESEDLLKRNYKLIYLTSSNMAPNQIAKVDFILAKDPPKANMLEFLSVLQNHQIAITDQLQRFYQNASFILSPQHHV